MSALWSNRFISKVSQSLIVSLLLSVLMWDVFVVGLLCFAYVLCVLLLRESALMRLQSVFMFTSKRQTFWLLPGLKFEFCAVFMMHNFSLVSE